jgi:hypothetical protein
LWGLAVVGLLVVPSLVAARTPGREPLEKRLGVAVTDRSQYVDVNRINMLVSNIGSFAFDGTNAALEFPKGSGHTAVFAGGLWLGGKINGVTKVAVTAYSNEWFPGPILAGGVPDDPTKPEHKVYKLNRVYSDPVERDAALLDYTTGAVPYGADPVSVQGDGTLNILGDQMTWTVYNEADSVLKATSEEDAGHTGPMGVEVQQTIFAFNRTGALGQTVFLRFRMINKGGNQIDSMFVSVWSDPDLGEFTDDLVGCDVPLSMGFVYNATNDDATYGTSPPCVGYDFFKGPTGYLGTELGLTSFNKYSNEAGGDPDQFVQVYNFMKGLNRDGTPVINPVNNQVTTFVVDGDPVSASGWLDSSPADRRLMLSSGPFQMAAGDTQEVVVGLVIGDADNRLASISLTRFYDSFAQSAFDQNFILAPPPNPPEVVATPTEDSAILSWDASSESYSSVAYGWEGYVVYQGASRSGPWRRLATYDRPNGITTVLDPDFDAESGQILPSVKALGTDRGVAYRHVATDDAFRGGPLRVGTPYYFAVSAYSVGIGQNPQVLESAIVFDPDPNVTTVYTVIPQTPAAGIDLSVATAGPVTKTAAPPNADNVQVVVVDPTQMITADYRVGYKPNGLEHTWYVVRTLGTTVDTLANNLSNDSGDENYPIFDGIQVKLTGPQHPPLASVNYVDVGPNPPGLVPADLPGVFDLCFDFYNCGADYGLHYFGGSALDPADDPTVFRNVEIRFDGGANTGMAYRYIRASGIYQYTDYVPVPWTVWDVDNNIQLSGGFLETGTTSVDGVWQPGTSGIGDREAIFVFAHPYTATADPFYTDPARDDLLAEGGEIDFMYFVWPIATNIPMTIDAGDKYVLALAARSDTDEFTFSTTAPATMNVALAKSELSRIKAVPNPYFAHSTYEINQFNRVVKFTHLPARCTVRIFTLTGELVRTLEKDDASTSQLVWDVETSSALPVASGIYIFHVDAPGIGTHVGKLAVFMEKERLNTF